MSIDFKERFRDRIDVIDKNGNFTKENSKPINAGKQIVMSNIYGNTPNNQVVNQQEQRQGMQEATFSKINTQQAGTKIINEIPQINYNQSNAFQQAESLQVQSAQDNWNPPQNIFQGQPYYSANPYLPSYPNSGGQMPSQYNVPNQLGQQQNQSQFQSYQDFLQKQQNFPLNNVVSKSLFVPTNQQQQPLNTLVSLQIPSGMSLQNQMQQMQFQQQGLNQLNNQPYQPYQPNMQQISQEFQNVLGQMQQVLEQQQKQIYQLQNQQGFSSQRAEVQPQKAQNGQKNFSKADKNALRKNKSKSQEPQDTEEKQSNSSQKQINGLKSRNFRQAQKNEKNEQQPSKHQDQQEIPNKPKSIFQYAKFTYEANKKNDDTDFNKKSKDTKYKEYNLQDYKNLTPVNKFGGLGPFNIGTSE